MGEPPGHSVFLVTGDPATAPASFTRFVLPFVYSLAAGGEPPSQPRYREYDIPDLQERRSYFTPETADVLFNRARWLQVSEEAKTLTLHVGQKTIATIMAPPRVVLFEAAALDNPDPILSTGFLLIDVSFPAGASVTLDDLLVINEMFRYWRAPFDGHAAKERQTPDGESVTYAQFISDVASNSDRYTARWVSLLDRHAATASGDRRLLSADAVDAAAQWIRTATGETGWIAYADERAFVWTCALTSSGSDGAVEAADWIRLLNVDLPSSSAATEFEREWLRSRTYERWKHYGTLYGFNSHSGAMLGQACSEPPTCRHFSELYFDQMLLLLYLRVSTFRFSRKLSLVSDTILSPGAHQEGFNQFRRLRRSFAFLTNLYRFPLLSSQQQGIEMYAWARKALDVDALFDEVQTEIESTHHFFEMVTAAGTAKMATALTYVAAIATVLAVFAAYVGTNWTPVLKCLDRIPLVKPEAILAGMLIALVVAVVLILRRFQRID